MDIYEGENWVGYVNQYSGKIITYTVSEKVLDDIRGYLVFNDNWHFYKKYQDTPTINCKKKLALVLESPHKDEYRINKVLQRNPNNGTLIPQRPANGFAGDQIDHFIQNRPWIKRLSTSNIYEVFVMNAIQYQCSAYDYIQGMKKAVRRLTDAIFWSCGIILKPEQLIFSQILLIELSVTLLM